MKRHASLIAVLWLAGCQSYDFAYQPDSDRDGRHLRFEVQTPSKADILFVVDNSISMREEQAALSRSFAVLIDQLAAKDTSYRVGLVSTDATGVTQDCDGVSVPPQDPVSVAPPHYGARGNCDRPEVVLRRPHDGARGRLLAAFDPQVWDIANSRFSALTATQKQALQSLFPAGIDTGPTYANGVQGVPWVIDRELVRVDACNACQCTACEKTDTCYQTCAEPVAGAFVRAVFDSNLQALGTYGSGWEEGIRAGLLAAGIDPRETGGNELDPAGDLTDPGKPNSFPSKDAAGGIALQSWLRDDALFAVMFVSDEEDCSMPQYLWDLRHQYEEGQTGNPQPLGSVCYQDIAANNLLPVGTMASLMRQKKGGSLARVVVGVIGGLRPNGAGDNRLRSAAPADCVSEDNTDPTTDCSCLAATTGQTFDARWCGYTLNDDGDGSGVDFPYCNALAGQRYVEFAAPFSRKVFESVCRDDEPAFSGALAEFANLVNIACFDLGEGVRPADPNYIEVRRRMIGEESGPLTLLEKQSSSSTEMGWFYDDALNKICLTGRERIVGDVYDIFIVIKDDVKYGQ